MSEFAKIDVEITENEKELLVSRLLRDVLHPASFSVIDDFPEVSFKDKVYDALVNEGILRLLQKEVERLSVNEKI